MSLHPYREFMVELATLSGDFIRPYFGRDDLEVETKSDHSPVTIADRGAEQLMRERIHARYPDHGIVGEEFGSEKQDAEFVWVLDPIDGTKSFTAAVPLFGTLIALLHRGQPALGCIHQPVLNQLLIGDNVATSLNGKVVRTRPVYEVEEATVLTSDPAVIQRRPECRGFLGVMDRARLTRAWGDCYGYLLVATGKADVMYDPLMNLWDIAALVPIIRGAGGVITDAQGGVAYPATSIVAAGTPDLHRHILAALGT